MNILLLLAHSIAEYDDMRMLADLGYNVFSIGAYTDPRNPTDDKRPALMSPARFPDLISLVEGDQMKHKEHLPDGLIDWADVIIAHHYVDTWLLGQWPRIRHKRVVWRTCGQSDFRLEDEMKMARRDGLEIVRYSPAERRFFEPAGHWAGQDALIRFGKYIDDYKRWDGSQIAVGNVTQNMLGRGEWCGLGFWKESTRGLPVAPAGPGSEEMGGKGTLSYPALLDYLRSIRVYLYTGTMPASYTLGLIEAVLTGTPVVSIGPRAWMGPDALFEAHKFAHAWFDDPAEARTDLERWIRMGDEQLDYSLTQSDFLRGQRTEASHFDVRYAGHLWREFLGDPGGMPFVTTLPPLGGYTE